MLAPEKINEQENAGTKLCEERSECRDRKRTEKGLKMDLEIALKKRNRAYNALKGRVNDSYSQLRAPNDMTTLTAMKQAIELDRDKANNKQDDVVDIMIKLGEDDQNADDPQFVDLLDRANECLAEIACKLKDLELERAEFLSQRSDHSSRSAVNRKITSSSDAEIMKEKIRSLKKNQEIERRKEELERRRKELEREFEEERLQIELSSAEIIEKIIKQPETNVNQVTRDNIQDPWDVTSLSQINKHTATNTVTRTGNPIHKPFLDTGNPTGDVRAIYTGNPTVDTKPTYTGNPYTGVKAIYTGSPKADVKPIYTGNPTTSVKTTYTGSPTTDVKDMLSESPVKKTGTQLFTEDQTERRMSSLNDVPGRVLCSTPAPLMDISWQLQTIQKESTEIQRQQVSLLKRLMLPAPKPPIFEGDILDYPKWEGAFDSLIEEDSDPSRKLYYLGQYTGGVAQKTINGLLGLRTEDAYHRARRLLKERYGNPYRIYEEYRKRLSSWPMCKVGKDMEELSDFLVMTQETMKTVGYLKELNSLTFIRQLATRLPPYYTNKWRESAKRIEEKKNDYTFNDLVEFVQGAASDATHPVFSIESLSATRKELETGKENSTGRGTTKYDFKRSQGTAFAISTTGHETTKEDTNNKYVRNCPLCEKPHDLEHCKSFLAKTPHERVDTCKSKGVCYSCLLKGHVARQCRKKAECNVCKKAHATLLHFDVQADASKPTPETAPETTRATNNCVSVCHLNCNNTRTSMIVPVWLHHKDNDSLKINVYAVLDEQSDTCFVTEDVCSQLHLSGPEIILQLGTMHSVENIATRKMEGLVISRCDEEVHISLPKAYSRDQIPVRREQIPRPENTKGWSHLEPIADKIAPYQEKLNIGILVGNNCIRAIKPREVIPGKASDPYAIRTALGWGIIGVEVEGTLHNEESVRCHCVTTNKIETACGTSLFIQQPTSHKEVMTPLIVRRMFEQEFPELQYSEKSLSQEDIKFMKMMAEKIHKTSDNHYEMPLPLRDGSLSLPCNRKLAEVRLNQLKKRFERDTNYKKDYVAFMEDMFTKGYAESAPPKHESVWYIPHHGVYHAKKPGKIRVVFDCSAQYEGHSLNQNLLQGPDLTNTLTGVLCRFRQEPVCFACDIEGMFCQVRVNEEHRDLLRFLFWEEGDTDSPPKEYRMKVHLFGATSSPGCANLALKKTAEDNATNHEKAAEFLNTNFYVDDGLASTSSVDEAVSLIKGAREMCSKGGFRLHKFISNRKEVLESVPVDDRAKGVKELNLSQDTLPIEKVLGVEWCIENDSFQFRIQLKDKPLTRRGILSTVSSIYDPLGFAAPFTLRGKKILQLLCKEGVAWDDPIPDQLRHEWQRWKEDLPSLEEMEIARCFKPAGFESPSLVQLHNFSDASVDGYGQCSYLRLVNEVNEVHCSLVMGKARVSPLKQITIPRLELAAAVASVRVSEMLHRELTLPIDEEVFWTDSQVVKAYINNEARRFHTYVANRVQQIREHSEPSQWRYVDSHNNPADDASRGMRPKDLQTSRWLQGPLFLWEPNENWRNLTSIPCELADDDKEVKKSIALATTTVAKESQSLLAERLSYFSDWFRAKRAVANCLKYLKILKLRVQNKSSASRSATQSARSAITTTELQEAEMVIIKQSQHDAYETVIKGKWDLRRLDPFIDSHGVIRVGGRLKNASIDYNTKYPIIIPKDSHVAYLIAKHSHEATQHQGRGMTLNEIRSTGYWIVSGGPIVSKLIHDCVTCRKLRAASLEQKMADLPSDRLEPSPPFTYCAVDYFGPWIIKEGRKELKRYGVLFTCLFSRAIHLEVSSSLDTSSYINALRRFICRRGPVRQLRSDRGTNFIGARRELQEALKEMDQERVKKELLKSNCDWVDMKFNAPSASHMGGVWERQIRKVRSVLSALLSSCGGQLNDEALRTFMCEAEAIVNGRPLTVDGQSAPTESLTPNHFLTMKSKVVLPPPGNFQEADIYSRKWWRRVQHLTNEFWTRWRKEFLLSLQERQKWTRKRRNVRLDDIVLIKDDDAPRNQWRLSKVVDVTRDDDGLVRKVKLIVGNPNLSECGKREGRLTILERPIHKLVLLLPQKDERPGIPDEEPINQ